MPFNGSYISDISHERALLTVRDKELRKKIKSIGGKRNSFLFIGSKESMVINYKNEEEKIHTIQSLINLGSIYFMHWDHSWPPSEVACFYREKGLIYGEIKRVVNPRFDDFETYTDKGKNA